MAVTRGSYSPGDVEEERGFSHTENAVPCKLREAIVVTLLKINDSACHRSCKLEITQRGMIMKDIHYDYQLLVNSSVFNETKGDLHCKRLTRH